MTPTLLPGDRLLVVPFRSLAAGDIVALHDPRPGDRLLIKRVRAVGPVGIDVVGDNPGSSTDSRHFGAVPSTLIVGRAVYRYHPPERAGRLRGRAAFGE